MVAAEDETILGLCARYSPSGQEHEAVDFLIGRMQSLGYQHASRDEAGNAVGMCGNGPRQIILLGHIDTVAGEIPIRIEGDDLYGRGAVDAKGALAVFTEAAADVDIPPDWQMVVIGAVEEEGDSKGARYIVDRYRPQYAIVGEPSRWNRITLGYKGSAWAKITVKRANFHTAGQGKNACETAFDLWGNLLSWAEQFNSGRSQMFEQVQLTLRSFASENDGLEQNAHLQVAARLPLDLTPQKWYDQLKTACDGSQASFLPDSYPMAAYRGDKNNALVKAFMKAIRMQGETPGLVLKTGTADMNIVAPRWGCPVVAYGPGDSALDHTPHEHISLVEYRRAVIVLGDVLRLLLASELQ
jgi:LysW-gamma-L-lysine carboxypeptidase